MLIPYEIEQVIDIRENPWSYNHDFNGTTKNLALQFAGVGIDYQHRQELGNPKSYSKIFQSERKYWRNLFFSKFQTLERLAYQQLFTDRKTALMCAEKDFRKCHRTEIAYWIARGSNPRIKVIHL